MIKLLFLLLLCPLAFANERAGNGAGTSENNIIYSWSTISVHLNRLLALEGNSLSSAGREFTKKILARASTENKAHLFFVTEKQKPFNGAAFLAEGLPGGTVYFNLDRLFMLDAGQKRPLNLAETMMLVLNVQKRDLLLPPNDLIKLQQLLGNNILAAVQSLSLSDVERPNIQLVAMNFPQRANVLLMDSKQLLDVTPSLEKLLPCPQGSATIQALGNLYRKAFSPEDLTGNRQDIYYKGSLNYACPGTRARGSFTLKANYLLQKKSGLITEKWLEDSGVSALLDLNQTDLYVEDVTYE